MVSKRKPVLWICVVCGTSYGRLTQPKREGRCPTCKKKQERRSK